MIDLLPSQILRCGLAAGLIALFFAKAAAAEPSPRKPEQSLDLSVTISGQHSVRRAAGRPIVVDVTLANPTAMNQLLDKIAAEADGNRKAASRKVDSITIDLHHRPISEIFAFEVSSPDGKNKRSLKVRPLTSAQKKSNATIVIDGQHSFRHSFALEPSELAQVGDHLVIRAHLASKPRGIEQIDEQPLNLELVPESSLTTAEKIQCDYSTGEYYIAEKQFDKVEAFAAALDQSAPQLAALLRSEMFLGLHQPDKARETALQALKLYGENTKGERNVEPPMYLFELLRRIDETKP